MSENDLQRLFLKIEIQTSKITFILTWIHLTLFCTFIMIVWMLVRLGDIKELLAK